MRISFLKNNVFIKVLFFVVMFFGATTFTLAFEPKTATIQKDATLTLSDCIRIALENSPSVRQAAYNYQISKNNVSIAKTNYFPTLTVGSGYYYSGTKTSKTSSNSDYYSVSTSLNQLIYDFGKTLANVNMQKFYGISSLYTFDNVVLDTIFGVKVNYYAVLAAKATVEVNKGNVQISERNYQRTKAYFDEGIRSKIDLVNAEVNLSDAKITLVQSQKAYEQALVDLNNSMYVAYAPSYKISTAESFNFKHKEIPVNLEKISDSKDLSAPPKNVSNAVYTTGVEKMEILGDYKFEPFKYSFKECEELAEKNRPDLKAYQSTLDAMKQALLYVKREYFPAITAGVGYGFRNQNNTNSLNANVAFTTNVNIAQEKFKIDNAKLQVQLAQNDLDLAKQNVYFDVQNAYVNMVRLGEQIPLLSVKVNETYQNLELADGRYAVGLGDYIQLQDARVNYNTAQNSYVQAVFNYNVARANLERLMALPQEIQISVED